MLTVQELPTVQNTAPGLTTITLIAWTLGPKLKSSFPNKQSTRTNLFFCSVNNNAQPTEAKYLVCFKMRVNQPGGEASNTVALNFGEKVVKLCLMSSLQKGIFYIMYTLPHQPRCITGLCNHCKFIYIFIFVPELQKGEEGISVKGRGGLCRTGLLSHGRMI